MSERNLRMRASESLEELRRSMENAGIGAGGGSHRWSAAGDTGNMGDTVRRNSMSDLRSSGQAAQRLSSMIASREGRLGTAGSHGTTSPSRGPVSEGLPPRGRSLASLANLPNQEELAGLVSNQTAYIRMLEAENKFSREELTHLKLKTSDLVEENRRLHEDMKSSVVRDLLHVDLRRSASTEDVAGHPRGGEDPGRRFRIDLERIGSMYAAKNRRLEVQLSQAKDDLQRLEVEVEETRSELRRKDSMAWQEVAEQTLRSGSTFHTGSLLSPDQLDRLTRERDELVTSVSALRARLERMQQREEELCLQLSAGIETVEQAKLEETQAVVQSRQLTDDLINLRARFEDQILENQKRLEEERKLARKEVAAELEALTKQLRENEREIARKETRLEKEIKAGRQMEASLEQARLQIKAFENDHSKTRDELQAALTRAGLHRDQAVAELSRMQQRLDAEQRDRAQERSILRQEVEELRARLTAAEGETMQANEDRLRLTNENQSLERDLNFARMQRDATQRGRKEEVASIRAMADGREREQQHFIAQMEARHESTAAELNEMLARHSDLVAKLREECRGTVAQMEAMAARNGDQLERLSFDNDQLRHQAERKEARLREAEEQIVQHGRTHQRMKDRLEKADEHAQHQGQQIVDLLARQNGLMRDRQLLAKEVEFLRSQLVTPLNLADCEKGDMREGPVEDLLRKVRVEDLVPPVSGN